MVYAATTIKTKQEENTMKKALSLVLALCMLLSVVSTAAAYEDPIPFQGSFPLTQDPITLNVFTTDVYYKQCEFQDVQLWSYMKDLTGVDMQFEAYSEDDISNKFSLMLTRPDDQLPDVIFRVDQTQAQVEQLIDEGVIVPITSYLEKYAPHYWYQIQHNPALKAYLTMNDGEIYGMAELHYAKNYLTSPVFVQGEWLKALGYDKVPEDLAELKEMLIKFRDSDMNGNGQKDEVGIIATGLDSMLRMFFGAFGINTCGRSSQYLDRDDNGALRFIPGSDNYRKMLTYIHELYSEGLIYEEIFSSSIAKMTAVGEENRPLIGKGSLHYLGSTNKDNYVGMDTIFKGPDGYQMNSDICNPLGAQNTFITINNDHIEETLQYFDYFYSREGCTLYFMGFEGVTYDVDENGDPWFNDYVNHNPDGLINEEVISSYVCWGGASNPTFYEDKTFGNNFYTPMESEVCSARLGAAVPEVWGNFNYTTDEYAKLATMESDIQTYVKDMRAKFITGEVELTDENWAAYISTLEQMHLADLMVIYQNGLDRYEAASK